MSAASQTAGVSAKPSKKKAKAWRELGHLLPYIAPYKKATGFGLVVLMLMGFVGAASPLIIGAITDLLDHAATPLPNLTGISRTLMSPILHFYAPGSRHALAMLCLALVAVVVVKGIFSFASRWMLIGISRDIEYDLRNNLLAK